MITEQQRFTLSTSESHALEYNAHTNSKIKIT